MNIKVTVNRRIVVNGKEYSGPEEMPEELRHAYERAMGSGSAMEILARSASRIVFRGKEYPTPADMPEDIRRLYDLAMAAAKLDHAHPVVQGTGAKAAGLVERDGVFVPDSRAEADNSGASGRPYTVSINLTFGRNGLLVFLAVLALVVWYFLSVLVR